MNDIITVMSGLKDLVSLKGASKETIASYEQRLGLSFAKDYTTYLEKYGLASARHLELTGITDAKRLDVVDVTLAERQRNQLLPDMYVIEDTGIEGILILQNQKGSVFEWNNSQTKKIYNCLADYVLSRVRA
ncbi:MAG: SMI1/KNR4 family protein [Tannerella sp.]|jgi:hypothetical protein|nr:SMI1/KNR4 family protein [Tannerella sp.]